MTHYEDILIEPVLSEKANMLREQGKYVFKVAMSANKIQIKEAVRRLFNVHPISCTVMVVGGKPKRLRNRSGYTATWKKAIVKLPKDEKIGLFEGV
ncbi:MAG: 50S ribosomal protein L23 [Treponema sp.]|nr:50S ribosomal protein L23 [Treponema sp.]